MKKKTKTGNESNDIVSQRELQELVELEKVKSEAESRRQSIKRRILAGAKVEPGPVDIYISAVPTIQLSIATVRRLLGPLSDQILAALPRRRIFRMHIKSSWLLEHKVEPDAVLAAAALDDIDEPDQEFDFTTFVLTAIPLILNKQDGKSSSSTMGNRLTNGSDPCQFDEFDKLGDIFDKPRDE